MVLTWESCWLYPLNWGAKLEIVDLNILGVTDVAPGAHNFLSRSPKAIASLPWEHTHSIRDLVSNNHERKEGSMKRKPLQFLRLVQVNWIEGLLIPNNKYLMYEKYIHSCPVNFHSSDLS